MIDQPPIFSGRSLVFFFYFFREQKPQPTDQGRPAAGQADPGPGNQGGPTPDQRLQVLSSSSIQEFLAFNIMINRDMQMGFMSDERKKVWNIQLTA